MATADEIIVRLTAQTAELKAGMAEGAAVVKTTQDEMAASMQSSMQSFRQFDAIQKGSITTAEELASAQAAVQAAQESGAFTAEEIAEKQALVAAAMKKVGTETQEASGFLSMFTRNSRTMYSTSALITDAMTGQFSRMRREVAALGNETGLMARAFQFAVSPAGMIAAALAAIALDAYNATQRINELQHAVLSGGGASGLSGDQLETMAEGFKKMGFDIQSARDAMEALAGSGRVTQADMSNATQASLAYAQLTGEKIDTLAKRFANLGTEGASGFIKLDESMHFLTNSQRDNIAQLQKQGETAKAVSVGYDALAAHGMLALQQLQNEGHKTEGFWAGVGTVIQNVNDTAMKGMGFGLTKQDELDKTNKLLDYYKQIGVTGEKINELTQKRAQLMAEIAEESRTYSARGAGAQSGIQADEALLHGGMHGKNGISGLEQKFQEQEAAVHASYSQMQQDAADFWNEQATNANNSTAVQAQAWQKYIAARHQLDEEGLTQEREANRKAAESARQAARAALKANEQQLRSLEQVRDAAKQASHERIDADLREVQFAIRAFGQKSAQFKEALHQMEQDSKEFEDKQKRDATQGAENARSVALAKISAARQAARTEYQELDITAAQLLQIENNLTQQKLAVEVAYLRAKQQIDQGDINAEKQIAAQLVVVQQKADQERLQNLQRFHQQAEQQWRRYTDRVSGMVSSQVTAMLFQHQTLRAAVANIAESMASTWIAQEMKQLFAHQAVEAAKTASTVAGNTARVAADTEGQAQSLAVQGLSAIKWITTEAAKAAAGAFNAMVSIPYIGPFLAVGASIAAGAAVMALVGKVASAEGGWERVPADGMTTVLHRDEMVLPARIAEPVRKMARNGGSGGGGATHFHFQSFAPRDFASYLKRNPAALRMALAHAGRNGW